MLGGDVAATETARFGLMAGYGNSKSNTASTITGYRARGQVNGYTTGLYGTWFAQGTDEKGLWADSTLQYSWFNNSVDGEDEAGESYRSKGLSASLSTGYVIPLGANARTAFFLQPQARVGWSGIKANDHTERNGTLVQGSGQDNVSSGLGVKAFMKGHSQLDENTGRQFGMFTELNWIHNTREYVVRMDGVSVSQNGSRNIAEARVGIDGALGGGLGVKGTIGQQVGDKGWSDTAAAISISYRF
jgi:autotransporter family porin